MRWLLHDDKSLIEMRSLETGDLLAAGKWEWHGHSRSFICRFDEGGVYEARRGFFVLVLPEKLDDRKARARIFWQKRRHSWESGELVPERFNDRDLKTARAKYAKTQSMLGDSYREDLDEARLQLHADLQRVRIELVRKSSELQISQLEEIDRAVERLDATPVELGRLLTGSRWDYEGKSKGHWVFGKKGKLNYNEGTNHAQGSWQLVDEDSVVAMLGGFYVVTFDLRSRRGHAIGFDRNGGRFERYLVWARK